MRKTYRVALVTTVVSATLGYSVSGSQLQGEDLIVNINFLAFMSAIVMLGVGIWWIGKAET